MRTRLILLLCGLLPALAGAEQGRLLATGGATSIDGAAGGYALATASPNHWVIEVGCVIAVPTTAAHAPISMTFAAWAGV